MSERDKDVNRRRKGRSKGRDVQIPPCEDLARRLEIEADDRAWLRYYCPELFWYPFTEQQREIIQAIRNAIVEGGDQAIAASRGEGKSKLAERLLLKYALQGVITFPVLFAATGSAAQDSLQSIAAEVKTNDRIAADYPEVCTPVRALEGVANRAGYMTTSGSRHDTGEPFKRCPADFRWCGQEIIFPNVPGAPSSGAIIATRGLDSAVRGLSKRDRRPDVAVLDDPDTEDTANSEDQARKLERRIDRGISGLGGQKRSVARVMLTTLQNRICASYRFTDPTQKPSWKGRRFRFLVKPPERLDLWDEYVQLRRTDWREETDTATALYLANREAMDAGAEVANPHRFTPSQLSALQFYFDQIARTDAAAVAAEFDNDPPEEVAPTDSNINPRTIQRQLSGLPQGAIPPGCSVLTQGIDVGKHRLHWVVRAWRADGTAFTVDYGTHDVHDVKYGSDEGLDRAIHRAIIARMEQFATANYATADGEMILDPLTLVDARYRTDAVYAACLEVGRGIYPVMGVGQSAGCVLGHWRDVQRASQNRRPGDGWVMEQRGRLWVVLSDADRWKNFEHDRWMTAQDKPGCFFLYGEASDHPDRLSVDERYHGAYAHQICAEIEVEELVKGSIRRRWKTQVKENHWLDASAYSNVVANMKGIQSLAAVAAHLAASQAPAKRPAVISSNHSPRRPSQSRW